MATSTAEAPSAFPSPFAIPAPPGGEGWEEMYPYYALFDEHRPEDAERFWFWNSMHFPTPAPVFDVICIDSPYQALGVWQNRVFAVPPAAGIDYRVVNGYVYIAGNPITDPEKIAERADFFQRRAGYYFANWPELYGRWKERMESLIGELTALRVASLPEYEPDEIAASHGVQTTHYGVLEAYNRALRLGDAMWQNHFEFLVLGYGAYSTFAEFCRTHLPDIPDQHIAQMVAGIDVVLFRPDAELRRLARLAVDTGVDEPFRSGRTPAEIDADLAGSDAGREWLAALEAIKEPWFNMATGDGLYHTYRNWKDDPTIPYASVVGHIDAIRDGRGVERPTAELEAERERLSQEYAALLPDELRAPFGDLLNLSRTVFPYVEEHKFYCDYWFLTNWWNKIREFGALLADHGFLEDAEDIFSLKRHEISEALDELTLSWATGGAPLGPHHWPPLVARRKEIFAHLDEWTPPPAIGATPEVVTDPMFIMHWGVTTDRVREWAAQVEGGTRLTGAAASPGTVEGPARVVRSAAHLADLQEGEVLVCGSTSPAWAPIFPKIVAAVTDIGGVMCHAAIVAREYGLPAVVGTGRATSQIRTGQRVRVDGSTGVVTLLES
jgi:pyruvate, water dikinase